MTRRYTQNPDPYQEWVADYFRVPERRHSPQNPFLLHRDLPGDQSTEFSFGPGPVAPHLNGLPPSEGGVHRGRAPRLDPPLYGVGEPRPHRRPRTEARGDAGIRVTR